MDPEAEKKWRRRSDARPAELTRAALGLFAEKGYAATRLEEVAARAGVSKGTIYRYFANKEALFDAVVREAVTPRFVEMSALFEVYEGSSIEFLRMLMQVAKRTLEGPTPSMLRLVIGESGNFPELARMWADLVAGRMMGLVERVLLRGMERGEFREVDAKAHVPLVMAPIVAIAVARLSLSGTPVQFDPDSVLDAHVEMLLRGLSAERKGATS
jgi:AcrR family transcriptional regulator